MVAWMVITTMLGANSSWTNPVIVQLNAALENNVNHVLSTDLFLFDLNAARLPGLKHLVLAFPLSSQHDAIMGLFIQVLDILHAKVNTLMHPAHVLVVSLVRHGVL